MIKSNDSHKPWKSLKLLNAYIEKNFYELQYPGDQNLVIIKGDYDLERKEIFESFSGRHWKELSLNTLKYHHEALFFFTPEAYRFYLPAYLRASILFYDESENIPGSLLFSLTMPVDSENEVEDFLLKTSDFNSLQKRTILAFLRFMKEKHSGDFPCNELDLIINRFWAEFE